MLPAVFARFVRSERERLRGRGIDPVKSTRRLLRESKRFMRSVRDNKVNTSPNDISNEMHFIILFETRHNKRGVL